MTSNTMRATLAVMMTILGLFVAAQALADEKQRVVYHVADENKVRFALNNIRNHIIGVGGKGNVEIVMVVHGPALKAFHDIQAMDDVRAAVASLQVDDVEFNACGNTMRAQQVSKDELVAGFIPVEQGGVVRIAELQQAGYLYIRP